MLVSSIGYFGYKNTILPDNSIKNQNTKVNLSEGFGHYNKNNKTNNNDSGYITNFINSFKSLFVKNKSEESSKYLSLIA